MNSLDRVGELERQVAEGQAQLAEAYQSVPQLATEARFGGPKERAGLRTARAKIRTLCADIELCEQELIYEREQANKKRAERQSAEQDAIKKRGMKKADALYDSLNEECRLISATIKQHHKTLDLVTEARAALPLREPIRLGFLLGFAEIRQVINDEITRRDGIAPQTATDLERTFPRAQGLGLHKLFNPAAIQPLAEKVATAKAALEKELQTKPAFPIASTRSEAASRGAPVSAPSVAAEPAKTITFAEAHDLVRAEAEHRRQEFPDNLE
jgi:hypothetical protein